MPAQRLPWFRFWVGATAHGKVRTLDDGTFRTWVELLDAASQQPRRGRFASRAEAAAITRRPPKHIAALIAATLIDETPEGLTMHDWDDWQRWRKEDVNDDGTPPEQPPDEHRNGYTNDSRTTTASTHDHPASLREKKIESKDVEKEKEKDVIPPAASPHPPVGAAAVASLAPDDALILERTGVALAPFLLPPGDVAFWLMVFEKYGHLDLEAEAFKQAAWMREHKIKKLSRLRYLNWLDRALERKPKPIAMSEWVSERTEHVCGPRCGHVCDCDTCSDRRLSSAGGLMNDEWLASLNV